MTYDPKRHDGRPECLNMDGKPANLVTGLCVTCSAKDAIAKSRASRASPPPDLAAKVIAAAREVDRQIEIRMDARDRWELGDVDFADARDALRSAFRDLDGAAGSSSPALAPWYEADGSTVMLPAEEVERRRKLAAKVIRDARRLLEASDEMDGDFSGARLDRLREAREVTACSLIALDGTAGSSSPLPEPRAEGHEDDPGDPRLDMTRHLARAREEGRREGVEEAEGAFVALGLKGRKLSVAEALRIVRSLSSRSGGGNTSKGE